MRYILPSLDWKYEERNAQTHSSPSCHQQSIPARMTNTDIPATQPPHSSTVPNPPPVSLRHSSSFIPAHLPPLPPPLTFTPGPLLPNHIPTPISPNPHLMYPPSLHIDPRSLLPPYFLRVPLPVRWVSDRQRPVQDEVCRGDAVGVGRVVCVSDRER